MPNFAKKIKLDRTLKELFLSFLLNGKYEAPILSREQQKLISYISEQFLISGFILKSCDFNLRHKSLVEQLKYQRRIQSVKQMIVKNDLNDIAQNLNDKGIEHAFLKGTALNADGIYPSGLRFSRDIDLLVVEDSVGEAYEILKSIGFKYRNKHTEDSIEYKYGHHFPEMINENNTKLELHWRATHAKDFKTCPITELMFYKRQVSGKNSEIYCPNIELTITHIVYHGMIAHRMDLGPLFLFDLAAIFSYFDKRWPINEQLLETMGVAKQFDICRRLVEQASSEQRFSEKSNQLINEILEESTWLRLTSEPVIAGSSIEYERFKHERTSSSIATIIMKIRIVRHLYQVSYFSIKFYFLLILHGFKFFKKMMRTKF